MEQAAVDLLEGTSQDVNLSHVQTLVNKMLDLESEIESEEEKIKEKKKTLAELKERAIPDAMGTLTSVKIGEGRTRIEVAIEKVIRANILKENREVAYNWLENQGHQDLIKASVEINYGREKLDDARKLEAELKARGIPAVISQEVHWATMNAFAKEQLNRGMEFPEFIGIYEGKTTKVKYGK